MDWEEEGTERRKGVPNEILFLVGSDQGEIFFVKIKIADEMRMRWWW